MLMESVKLDVPESLYRRLEHTAQAMARPVHEVMLHALQTGSPPCGKTRCLSSRWIWPPWID